MNEKLTTVTHDRGCPNDAIGRLENVDHDPSDPNPWVALYLDTSVPFNECAKASILVDVSSRSRQFLFPLIRPLCRLTICLLKVVKTLIPNAVHSSWLLHHSIYHGLRIFVSPYANHLIMRHFHIGSELLAFVANNTKGVDMELSPLRPRALKDLVADVFLKHDLNIYNFIIEINRQLNEKELEFEAQEELDYSCITDGEFPIEPLPNGWLNFLDLESAIEIYTPAYQMLLTDADFWRASNSLQLDETISLYATTLIGDHRFLGLVNNRHPIIPESTLGTGHRLMLHGLSAECLHAFLVKKKREQARQQSAAPQLAE
ncbi:DUF6999 family protein [Stratiformator vulcanicus]|uniref:Uncharacterized protein n=1 Tax=Stratiformator vulcanicus TaxID=2527980 RepID=A0A517R2C2_9PLAN|nr:hypothetical protein [Stratiformator vulcanicus]QDT38008.1 hypothetical protein Pan189_23920 [Stratiformator vulcanicus]